MYRAVCFSVYNQNQAYINTMYSVCIMISDHYCTVGYLGLIPYSFSPGSLSLHSQIRMMIQPITGIRARKNQVPFLPMSCIRRQNTEIWGIRTAKLKIVCRMLVPPSSGTPKIAFPIAESSAWQITINSAKYQYSLLRARPLKVAYFLKQVVTASIKEGFGTIVKLPAVPAA